MALQLRSLKKALIGSSIMCDLFILAAEPSGDLQGAHLVEALRSIQPSIHIQGVAGPLMRQLGVKGEHRMEELQVMGFTDIVTALPRLYHCFTQIRSQILQINPRAVICIDYPGFNLRLERSLRRHGYKGKLIHFICPTVWAWGKKRIPIMAQNLDLLLTLFPFEKSCFEKTSLTVKYIGHPLVKKTAEYPTMDDFRSKYCLDPQKKILALFPGSRETEIRRNFHLQLEAATRLQQQIPDLQIAVSLARPELQMLLDQSFFRSKWGEKQKRSNDNKVLRNGSFQYPFVIVSPEHRYDLMHAADLAIATSGTVTLELALFQTPTVVNFAIRPIDVFIAQKILRINLPHYCIVNIIEGKTVFPELLGPNLTIESLTQSALQLWTNREKCIHECGQVRFHLGNNDASLEAAKSIFEIVYP